MKSIEEIYSIFQKSKRIFTDSRQAKEGGIFFALKGDNFNGNNFAAKAIEDGADYAIVDDSNLSGHSCVIVVDNVLTTLQNLATYHRRKLEKPILAITGTNGKTTTKELTAAVLSKKFKVLATKGNLNNHIGVPITLLSLTDEHEVGIIEMGANHPGEIDLLCSIAEPDFGLITNVGKAHLEGFGSFEGVIKTKGELYNYISNSGKGIFINSANEHLTGMANPNTKRFTYAPSHCNAELIGEVVNDDLLLTCKLLFPKGWLYFKTNFTGAYNLENILAASRVGTYFNVDPLMIKDAIESYLPSNSRSQIMKKGSSTLIVDCYNANPSSMALSLENFFKNNNKLKTVILGEMLELGESSFVEHQKIVNMIVEKEISHVFLIGNNFAKVDCPEYFKKYDNVEMLKSELNQEELRDRIILIKGSRGNRLEKVLDIFDDFA